MRPAEVCTLISKGFQKSESKSLPTYGHRAGISADAESDQVVA
jgi:hypothetical protein